MSKGYKNRFQKNGHAEADPGPEKTERPFIYTEDGRMVYVKSISLLELTEAEQGLEKHFRAKGEPLDPPNYTVKVAGGGELDYPLTADILETDDPEETERRKTAWAAHVDAVGRYNAENGRNTQKIILEGVDADVPADGIWEARMRRRYIEVPDDPILKRQKYLLTEVLKTPEDWMRAQNEILLISSSGAIQREAVEAASATFRSQLYSFAGEDGEREGATRENGHAGRDGGEGAEEKPAEVGTLDPAQ